jgi:putative aldouronate transport system permease protein
MALIKEGTGDKIVNFLNLFLLTVLFLVVLYPLIFIVSASFSDPQLVSSGKVFLLPKGINVEGYVRIFRDKEIMIGYRNTIFYTVAGTLVNLALTLPAAYALSKKDLVGRRVIMLFMALTMYFSGGMIPTYLLVKSLNLINTWIILLIGGAVSTYNLIIARTFFITGVPHELEEASIIDGCSQARTFLLIVLPVSKALIGVMALYYGIGHWNSFFSALIYITDRNKVPLQLVLREILIGEQMREEMLEEAMSDEMQLLRLQLATLIKFGVIVVSSAPVMVAYPFLQKYFNKGIMLGSLKG